jgi:histone deacetylase 1/2
MRPFYAGHANCVKFVKSFNKPLLLLGGGGYTMRNVSRAWAYETGLAAGMELGPSESWASLSTFSRHLISFKEIPINEYYEYFGPDYQLDVKASNAEDMNTRAYLDRVTKIVMQNLRHIGGPPGIQMSGAFSQSETTVLLVHCYHDLTTDIPSHPMDDLMDDLNADEDMISQDERRPRRLLDSRRQADGELSDSDDEGEGGRRNHASEGSGIKFGIGVGIMSSGQRNVGAGMMTGAGASSISAASGSGMAGRMGTNLSASMEVDDEGQSTSENGINGGNVSEAVPLRNGILLEKDQDQVESGR